MPSYDYECDACQVTFEIQHPMEETMDYFGCLNEEDGCPGILKRVFTAPAVSFKGQGWGKVYRVHKGKQIDG